MMWLFSSLDFLSFYWLTHEAKAWRDTWFPRWAMESCFQYSCLPCKNPFWIIYLFGLCKSKSFYWCLIKCDIIFSLLFIRFLAAEGRNGCRSGWGQWSDGWKIVENLIWMMVIYSVIILPGSWVKTRGYGSELSICLNICCKNWMFFFSGTIIYIQPVH